MMQLELVRTDFRSIITYSIHYRYTTMYYIEYIKNLMFIVSFVYFVVYM